MNATYLLLDLGSLSLPLLFSFHPKIRFARQWRAAFAAIAITAVPFLLWDVWFTRLGAWAFNPRFNLGWDLLGLPLEEILFFVCIPYANLFLYAVLRRYWPARTQRRSVRLLFVLLALGWIIIGLFTSGIYSIVIGLLGGASILLAVAKMKQFETFVRAYLIHLIPFFIVNGLLTALPVVTYSSQAILNVRLGSIPVEDLLYSWILFQLTVMLYEYFRDNVQVFRR
ncbi:MAG: lycopene cyclase domain-containing protein [Fidelibacterota bacterium]|nr:MAG: lycopene cyclase domain-containing protein [Candidatus Neomarinimicrobiota bacterium]